MKRLLAILTLCPLAVAAAEWRYDGQSATEPAASVAEPKSMSTAMATPPGRALEDVPVNNMTMPAVRERYGDPERVFDPVGEPPITRWQYPDYVVYFENLQVITTVAGRL